MEDEPPLEYNIIDNSSKAPKSSKKTLKKILLSPEENKFQPPLKLKTGRDFIRLGILNPAVVQDDYDSSKIILFPRLIYSDENGMNSCILKRDAILERENVIILPGEETIFQAESPHGEKGVEDFRTIKLQNEDPLHGFLVYYNGFDARTGYVRTLIDSVKDYSKWDKFGIYFPNISAQEAISLVKAKRYKENWEKDFGKIAKEKAGLEGKYISKDPFLETKDCCLYPKKVIRKDETGALRGYYAIIIRLLPDIQMVYIKDFLELASQEFWKKTIKNLDDYVLLERKNDWEKSHIGLAGPPIELESGILISYHGVNMNPKREYKAGAVLVDKENPTKILARTKKPILKATESWEKNGVVEGDVVFPTGYAIHDNIIHQFYGAGDKYVAHKTTTENKIFEKLKW